MPGIKASVARRRRSTHSARDTAVLFLGASLALVAVVILLLHLPVASRDGRRLPLDDVVLTVFGTFSGTYAVVDPQRDLSGLGQVLVLVVMQIGGLGYMVGATLVLTMLRGLNPASSLRAGLMIRDGSPALSLSDALDISRRVIRFILVCEGIGAVAFAAWFAGRMPLHDAVWQGLFYGVGGFCNGGLDLTGSGLSIYPYRGSVAFHAIMFVLIQLGALSWLVWSDVGQRRSWSKLRVETRLILLAHAGLLVVGTLGMLIGEWNGMLREDAPVAKGLRSLFHAASARSAGYTSVQFAEGSDPTQFLYSALMLIGGAPGSTAGGFRLTTLAVLIVAVVSTMAGHREAQVMRRRISPTVISQSLVIAVLLFGAWFGTTLLLGLTEHRNPADFAFTNIAFEAASAVGSVGYSTGDPASYSTAGKLVVSLAMLVGKAGPLTVAYALQRRVSVRRYRVPETPIHLG